MLTFVIGTNYERTMQWLREVFANEPGFTCVQEPTRVFARRTDLDALVLLHPMVRELLKTGEPLPHIDRRGRPMHLTEAMITSTKLCPVAFIPPWAISQPYFASHGAGPFFEQLATYDIYRMYWERILAALDEWNESAPDDQIIRHVGYHVDVFQTKEPLADEQQRWCDEFLGILDTVRDWRQQR